MRPRNLHPEILAYIKRNNDMSYARFVECTKAKHVAERNRIWLKMWEDGVSVSEISRQCGRTKRHIADTLKVLRGTAKKEKNVVQSMPKITVLALKSLSKKDPLYTEKAEKIINKLIEFYEKENI